MSIISFKTAYRSLVKRKGFSLLNMLGLAIFLIREIKWFG